MKWLSQYGLIEKWDKQALYVSNRTGHKVLIKRTKIHSGIIEVCALQTLKGNWFPKLLDYKISGDEMQIALQFIEGETFGCLNEKDLCPYTINKVLLSALTCLDEIHKQGFIHCDIKPDNMIFDNQFNVYIIDFGTAQSHQDQRVSDEWMGSPLFMPPEALFTPGAIDCRSDYYSFAKSFEMSVGHKIMLLSYNAIACLKTLCSIIPNERPSNLSEMLKILKY